MSYLRTKVMANLRSAHGMALKGKKCYRESLGNDIFRNWKLQLRIHLNLYFTEAPERLLALKILRNTVNGNQNLYKWNNEHKKRLHILLKAKTDFKGKNLYTLYAPNFILFKNRIISKHFSDYKYFSFKFLKISLPGIICK